MSVPLLYVQEVSNLLSSVADLVWVPQKLAQICTVIHVHLGRLRDYLRLLMGRTLSAVFAPPDSNPHFKNRPDSDLKVDMIIIISNGIVLFI